MSEAYILFAAILSGRNSTVFKEARCTVIPQIGWVIMDDDIQLGKSLAELTISKME